MQSYSPIRSDGASTLVVGQDAQGHWLVQESLGQLEGCFVSFEAALGFARRECHSFPGATVTVSRMPLTPHAAWGGL